LTRSAAGLSLTGAPVRGVLFDYGNTLVAFTRPDAELRVAYDRIAVLLHERGLGSPLATDLLSDVHRRVEDEFITHQRSEALEEIDLVAAARRAYADFGLTLDDEMLDEILRIEQESWWRGARVDPDAVAVIEQLRAAGIRVGLCSNAPYRVRSMHDQLEYVGLAAHLDSVTFSGEIGWRKPSPRIFERALQALGTEAYATVMVGDTERDDIEGAHAAGMRAVLLRNHGAAYVDNHKSVADVIVEHLAEIHLLLS
jgi:HAD superfamily hydrolase (TIGR01509 family)